MVEFQFPCPHCGSKIACEAGYTGWQITCPACQQNLVVPGPGGAAPSAGIPAGQMPGYAPPGAPVTVPESSQRSGLAVAALFLSIFGLPGIICGHMAVGRLRKNPQLTGGPLALAGLVIGYVCLALMISAIAVLAFRKKSELPNSQAAATPSGSGRVVSPSSAAANKPASAAPVGPEVPETVWEESFEAGMEKWSPLPECTALTLSNEKNHSSSGGQSAKLTSAHEKMYRDIGPDISNHARVSFWIYDSGQDRAFGEVRGYMGGKFGDGRLQQLFAIGRYTIRFAPNATGDIASQKVEPTRYQGRVMAGINSGWFNLDESGAPSRSPGWHKFEIERENDGATIKFYVDGSLGRTVNDAARAKWNVVTVGSIGTDKVNGSAWFDDIKVESFAPKSSAAAQTSKPKTTTKRKKK